MDLVRLDGAWRAAPADEGLRRSFAAPGFADDGWEPIGVPGHWRSVPAFSGLDGPLLYRRPFAAALPEGARAWLTLDGIFYDGDVWLDGSYVGATEGYFFPHSFEVTEALAARGDHVLAVEVGCSREGDRTAKRNLTGVFQHWDCADPAWNPGGIWRPVHVSSSGPVRIERVRLLCTEATAERATVEARAVLDARAAVDVDLRLAVAGVEVVAHHALAAGRNDLSARAVVDRPQLWWPHALGDQPLHDAEVSVLLPDGQLSDRRVARTGLRQVRMRNFVMSVNGERLFLKGSNQGPSRMALADASPAELEQDVLLARQAGLDLLRLHAHVSRPELYDAADRHGLLLWQDLPLQWGYARGVRREAVRQAREAVDLLGHHPAVAVWCGHNEPLALEPDGPHVVARFAALQALPTWNKTVLDTSIGRALERADPSRPVVAHSGVLPGPLTSGTDTHLYCGWYHGDERDFPAILRAVPRLARFVTEFGAQAVPSSAGWMEPQRWPDLDWDELRAHHALQLPVLDRHVPRDGTFEEWVAASQEYQAQVVRFHVEALRRLKYRPTGGFCQFSFADGYPAVTWAVLDHARRPKAGYAALVAACAPVVVIADRPAASYPPGAPVRFDVHVVSDLRRPLAGARVTASLGAAPFAWEGDVPADSCTRVGTVRAELPAEPGPVHLSLALTADGGAVTAHNSYVTEVVAQPAGVGRS
jgi:beta-mannosidase